MTYLKITHPPTNSSSWDFYGVCGRNYKKGKEEKEEKKGKGGEGREGRREKRRRGGGFDTIKHLVAIIF